MAVLILLAFAVVPLTAVVLALRLPRLAGAPFDDRLAHARRTIWGWRAAGGVAGIVTSVVLSAREPLGRGLMLAAPAFSLCLLLGIILGESRVSAPVGRFRSAPLEVRRPVDYLPRPLMWSVAVALGGLAVLLVISTTLAAPDDMGRAGRALFVQCGAELSQTRGPWPGSFYSLPLAASVLGGLLAAALAVRGIVRRPRQGPDVLNRQLVTDDALRARSVRDVVAGVGILVTVPLAGALTVCAMALSGLACRPSSWTVLLGAVTVSIPVSSCIAVWCAVLLLAPRGEVGSGRKVLL